MTLIPSPPLVLSEIEWTFDQPSQQNLSAYSEARTSDTAQWYGKFSAKVTLATITGESNFAPVRSFLFRCNGPANTFQIPATVEPQNANGGVTLGANASAGDTSVTLSGTTTPMLDGQMITVGGQLLHLTSDQSAGVVTFEPPLRSAANSGDAAETANPYATVFIPDVDRAWAVSPVERFDCSFNVEEAI